jgi:hypothetical protein
LIADGGRVLERIKTRPHLTPSAGCRAALNVALLAFGHILMLPAAARTADFNSAIQSMIALRAFAEQDIETVNAPVGVGHDKNRSYECE